MLATYILMDVISVKYLELFRWKMPSECQELLLLFLSPAFPMGLSFPVTFVRPLQPASCSVTCHPSDILYPSRGCDRTQSKSSWNIACLEGSKSSHNTPSGFRAQSFFQHPLKGSCPGLSVVACLVGLVFVFIALEQHLLMAEPWTYMLLPGFIFYFSSDLHIDLQSQADVPYFT